MLVVDELTCRFGSKTAVDKERPKLEWSERTVALRRYLDVLYARFRDSVRHGA